MKKNLFEMPRVAIVVLVSIFCSCSNKGNASQTQTATNDVAVESTEYDPAVAKQFLGSMYKDFFEPWNENRQDESYLSKFFTKEAMGKFYVESDYDEGDFFYCTDFLINGDISGDASPDYGNKVVSRTIEPKSDGWFLVANIWDVIKKPVKVLLKVEVVGGKYKVTDIALMDDEITVYKVQKEGKKKDGTLCSVELEYPTGGNENIVNLVRNLIVANLNMHTNITYNGSLSDADYMVKQYCDEYINNEDFEMTMCQITISKFYECGDYISFMSSGCSGGASQHYWTEFLTVNKKTGGRMKYENLFAGDRQELMNTIYQYKSEDDPIDELESCEIMDAMLTPDKAVFVVSGFHGNYPIDVPVSSIKKYLSEEGKKIIDPSVN